MRFGQFLLVASTIALFAVVSITCGFADSAAEKRVRINRENALACLKIINKLDHGNKLASWTGNCQADKLAEFESGEYAAEAASTTSHTEKWSDDAAIVLSGEACRAATTRAAATGDCGIRANGILGQLQNAEVLISLPGGRCARYVPLLLSDKTSSYTCTALRARRACVHVSTENDVTVVTLSTLPDRKGLKEQFRIHRAQVDQWLRNNTWRGLAGRVPHDKLSTGQLYLLRAATRVRIDSLGDPARLVERIRLQAESAGRICRRDHGSRRDVDSWCKRQRQYHAERIALEAVRVDLNLRHLKSAPERAEGLGRFVSYMEAQKPSLSQEASALYNAIVYNEIGVFPARDGASSSPYASPYQLLDAIYGNSALSWGAKQIDFWGNLGADVDDFWAEVSKPANKVPKSFLMLRACLSNPGKTLPILALRTVLNDTASWNDSLDAPAIREFHNEAFVEYIRRSVTYTPEHAPAGRFLQQSLLGRVYYIDQVNQKGERLAQGVLDSARTISMGDNASQGELCRAEAMLFKKYNELLKQRGHTPYTERQRKLAEVINFLEGRDKSECIALERTS